VERDRAGVFRRLAAAVYDGLLLLAVLMLLTATLQLLTHGAAITRASVGGWEYPYRALLALTLAGYFGVAWTRGGQTLGMKAWQIRLERANGTAAGWAAVGRRLLCAAPLYVLAIYGTLLFMMRRSGWPTLVACYLPVVASFAWHACTGRGTLHDRLSGTRVVRLATR
jgi:uncharacterized RDD family membrane protein YckC